MRGMTDWSKTGATLQQARDLLMPSIYNRGLQSGDLYVAEDGFVMFRDAAGVNHMILTESECGGPPIDWPALAKSRLDEVNQS